MKERDYTMTTLEEFLALPQDNTNLVIALPARALSEIEAAKNSKNQKELVTKALKNTLSMPVKHKLMQKLLSHF